MTLPKENPTSFCRAFIQRELNDYREKKIHMPHWPVMERMIDRADELKLPFEEIIASFGYSDCLSEPIGNSAVWLILEHIWLSSDFQKAQITDSRAALKEILGLQSDIVTLARKLAEKLRRQSEIYESSGFTRADYQGIGELIDQASSDNHLYKLYIQPELSRLTGQFDLKYWPTRSDLVEAIATFEEAQPEPKHYDLPEQVIQGRASDIKDFVLAFDGKFDAIDNDLPRDFEFSHNALADIMNIVLDVPYDQMVTGDAVRNTRHKNKKSLVKLSNF
ncbi:hypothetical protein QWY20_08100 [Alkalimonas sp. MEB108]|uniref:Uncharacterized protein n=1 Tax=Alkalimonas cellulosilytica TaxID=3058395 RepID=A0ABU7J4Z7_9GAMM|nr:hypothetical protein [Alkalimonas sp. MEB108]MEE2001413.1 hypothetical protein [Alkalimonas sp. MEB108]